MSWVSPGESHGELWAGRMPAPQFIALGFSGFGDGLPTTPPGRQADAPCTLPATRMMHFPPVSLHGLTGMS